MRYWSGSRSATTTSSSRISGWRDRGAGEALRALARQAIEDGRMPQGEPQQISAGLGMRTVCMICDQLVTSSESAVEASFSHHGSRPDIRYFHARCFAAWEQERRTLHT